MATEPDSIVLEHLRAIRTDLGDLKEGQTRMELRLASIESDVPGFRIERRLELADGE